MTERSFSDATAGFCRDDCININSPVQSRLAVNRKRTALDTECLDTESSSDGQEGTCDLNHTMRELKALLLKQTPAHTQAYALILLRISH